MYFRKYRIGAFLARGLAFALLWWVLTEGRSDSWGVGLVSVALATFASLWLWPSSGAGRLSIVGLFGFASFFLIESVKGGVQVAAMALRPRLDLEPALVEVPLTLPPGSATVLLVNTLSLLPGTLSVRIEGNRLRMHVLDARLPVLDAVRAAEARIARLFRVAS